MTNTRSMLQGKKGLIMGLANDKSIAWGIAQNVHAQGAELAFSYQGDMLEKRVRPLAESLDAKDRVFMCDVSDDASIDQAFSRIKEVWGTLDFLVHSIAFSKREELSGEYLNTSRENFLLTMDISCYSLVATARAAAAIMPSGGSILTLSYYGAEKVIPNYNVMGVAKSALETSVRYLAADLGPKNIRVNAISAGPIRSLAASGISDFRKMLQWNELSAPLRRNVTIDDIGRSAAYFLSDIASGVTGEIHHVDGGYNITGMVPLENVGKLADIMGQN